LSAESQLFMINVVLFSYVTFLHYVSLTKYYHEYYCKGWINFTGHIQE